MGALYILGVGLAGGVVGHKLNLPAGGMLGAIIAVALFKQLNIAAAQTLPVNFALFAQVVIGISIGASFSSGFFRELKTMAVPAFTVVLSLLMFSALLAFILTKTTDIDLVTLMLAVAPGGLTEMGAFSLAFKAQTAVVLTVHLLRILAITVAVPLAMYFIGKS